MALWLLLTSCVLVWTVISVWGLKQLLDGHKALVEILCRSNVEVAASVREIVQSQLEHMRDANPIGGLPRELWLEQHELRKREMAIREKAHDAETPLRRLALETKIRRAGGRLGGSATVTNPES